MLSHLHPALPGRIDDLRRQFAERQPFRHVVIEPFLEPALCDRLIAEFPAFDEKLARNESGDVGRKAVFSNLANLGKAYARFDAVMRNEEFLTLAGRITGLANLLYDADYVGGGTHENLDGQELDSHVDFNRHPGTHWHRRLNLILFLNPEWEASWGGCLELLADPFAPEDSVRQVVVPVVNRAVIFETTEWSWHGFRRIRLPVGKKVSRRSIAVYFYTKERAAEETAPSHATIYYQRPLPAHIRAGHILSEEDRLEIETLLARRDGVIRFLYKRELEFSEELDARAQVTAKALEAVTGSLSFRLGRALTAPARAARSLLRRHSKS